MPGGPRPTVDARGAPDVDRAERRRRGRVGDREPDAPVAIGNGRSEQLGRVAGRAAVGGVTRIRDHVWRGSPKRDGQRLADGEAHSRQERGPSLPGAQRDLPGRGIREPAVPVRRHDRRPAQVRHVEPGLAGEHRCREHARSRLRGVAGRHHRGEGRERVIMPAGRRGHGQASPAEHGSNASGHRLREQRAGLAARPLEVDVRARAVGGDDVRVLGDRPAHRGVAVEGDRDRNPRPQACPQASQQRALRVVDAFCEHRAVELQVDPVERRVAASHDLRGEGLEVRRRDRGSRRRPGEEAGDDLDAGVRQCVPGGRELLAGGQPVAPERLADEHSGRLEAGACRHPGSERVGLQEEAAHEHARAARRAHPRSRWRAAYAAGWGWTRA